MLSLRLLTAAVLVPLLVWAIFALSPAWLSLLIGAFVALAAWEWASLAGLTRITARIAYTVGVCAAGAVLLALPGTWGAVLVVGVAFWIYALYALTEFVNGQSRPGYRRLVTGPLALVPCWIGLAHIAADDPQRPWALLYLLVLVWLGDSAAYFAGRAFGRYRLAPRISPGKTVEGLAGEVVAVAALAAFAGSRLWGLGGQDLLAWILLSVVVVLFSVLGDLFESVLKRQAGVKDSGKWLPGHGGMLDRIDSLTAATPVFVLGWWTLFAGAGSS